MMMGDRDIYRLRHSDEFCLGPGQEASVDLSLEKAPPLPCAGLYGKVVCGLKPVPEATVKILGRNHAPLYHTDTDAEGRFSFGNTLMPGRCEIIASADGYYVSESLFISLKPFSPSFVTIRLRPDESNDTAAVYGTVRDWNNEPLAGALVFIFARGASNAPPEATATDSDGGYLVYGLAPGEYAIAAFLDGYYLPADREVSLSAKDIACADLYLYRNEESHTGTVSGKVVNDGAPVPNALAALYIIENGGICLIGFRRANSRGIYLFSGLKPGCYIVKAKAEDRYFSAYFNVV